MKLCENPFGIMNVENCAIAERSVGFIFILRLSVRCVDDGHIVMRPPDDDGSVKLHACVYAEVCARNRRLECAIRIWMRDSGVWRGGVEGRATNEARACASPQLRNKHSGRETEIQCTATRHQLTAAKSDGSSLSTQPVFRRMYLMANARVFVLMWECALSGTVLHAAKNFSGVAGGGFVRRTAA